MADAGDIRGGRDAGAAAPHGVGAISDGREGCNFLIGRAINQQTLAAAERLAQTWQVPVHRVLLSTGRVAGEAYAMLLADHLALGYLDADAARGRRLVPLEERGRQEAATSISAGFAVSDDGLVVIDASVMTPSALARFVQEFIVPRHRLALVSSRVLGEVIGRHRARSMLRTAVLGLASAAPDLSAASGLWTGQAIALVSLVGLALGGLIVAPHTAINLATALISVPILGVVTLRALAFLRLALHIRARAPARPAEAHETRAPEAALPIYTILVPLFRETRILPQLITALGRLDYPAAKLDIKLVLESIDEETRRAVAAMRLPSHFEIITVPDRLPRTKPKALAYALQMARGQFVVVFDAEDIPEPGQLRTALTAFEAGGSSLACVQAGLDIYNPCDNWLTRQFTIEYASLFVGLLPLFERLGLPLPLSGSSNHFRLSALGRLGAWDPFNVTEDADLGMRLARAGYRCHLIAPMTFEEAPRPLDEWFRQRTRWVKGWLQTYIVHTRRPIHALGEFGLAGFLGFHAILGGLLLSALLHPLFYLLSGIEIAADVFLDWPDGLIGRTLWGVATANLVGGYVASMALGARAAQLRGLPRLGFDVLTMPIYWLLISAAAWRALWQLVADPFKWEKTAHGLGQPMRGPGTDGKAG